MLKVLIAGLLGTLAGIAVMVVVIVATGTSTDDASSVGLNASVSTATVSTPASSAPASSPGGGSGGSSSGATGDATAGKAVFASNGCGSCHTLSAAGATGTIGPDLDKTVSGDAQKANMPLAAFIKQSITDPNKDIAQGYQPNIMPATFKDSLTPKQIDDLVAFLTKPS